MREVTKQMALLDSKRNRNTPLMKGFWTITSYNLKLRENSLDAYFWSSFEKQLAIEGLRAQQWTVENLNFKRFQRDIAKLSTRQRSKLASRHVYQWSVLLFRFEFELSMPSWNRKSRRCNVFQVEFALGNSCGTRLNDRNSRVKSASSCRLNAIKAQPQPQP